MGGELTKTGLEVFDSFEDADQAQREEWWAMTPGERLELLEKLRQQMYEESQIPLRLQRSFEVLEFP